MAGDRDHLGSRQPCAGPDLAARALHAALFFAVSSVVSACSGSSFGEGAGEACTSSAECGAGRLCEGEVCVEQAPAAATRTAGLAGCEVLECPDDVANCCRAITAGANGNEAQGYGARLDLLEGVSADRDGVTATFSFRAPEQQGWVAFDLGEELELSRVLVIGRHSGVDPFLTLSANQPGGGGCAFAFELAARPATELTSMLSSTEVELNGNDFCSSKAAPGRASELVFGIFAKGPGQGALTITAVELTGE